MSDEVIDQLRSNANWHKSKKIFPLSLRSMFECFKYKMRRLWILQEVLCAFTNKPGTSILIYQGPFYGVGLAHYGRENSLSKSHELIVGGIVMSWKPTNYWKYNLSEQANFYTEAINFIGKWNCVIYLDMSTSNTVAINFTQLKNGNILLRFSQTYEL